jgi:NAD(P)H-hydrate epimerase
MALQKREITPALLAEVFKARPRDCHKGSFGYVTLLGGSLAYSGAAKLANLAASALRAGCGVVRLAVPQSIAHAVMPYLLESTLYALPDESGSALCDPAALDGAVRGVRALGIGMGWEEDPTYLEILRYFLSHHALPTVIDAGGLNALSHEVTLLDSTACTPILTPHPKEFSRLSGLSMEEILRAPATVAGDFARAHRCIVLLKGSVTTVTDGTEVWEVDRGCAGMATAGSGDVLTGILTGMLGYLPTTAQTVACGAYLAGLAGELAQERVTDIAMIASDTVSAIPAAIRACRA